MSAGRVTAYNPYDMRWTVAIQPTGELLTFDRYSIVAVEGTRVVPDDRVEFDVTPGGAGFVAVNVRRMRVS